MCVQGLCFVLIFLIGSDLVVSICLKLNNWQLHQFDQENIRKSVVRYSLLLSNRGN